MKRYLYYIILIGIIILLVIGFSAWVGKLKAELVLSNNTNQSFLSGDSRQEKTITKVQFVTYYPKADSTAKAHGIKTKYITKFIKIKETLIDTIFVPLYDSLGNGNIQTFQYNNSCISAFGIVQNDSVVLSYEYNNELDLFQYWSWRQKGIFRKIWNWDFSKFNSALVVSKCSGDTLKVIENLEIIKK